MSSTHMYSILTVALVDLVIVTRVMATGIQVVVKVIYSNLVLFVVEKVNIIGSLLAWEQK